MAWGLTPGHGRPGLPVGESEPVLRIEGVASAADAFGARSTLDVGGESYEIFRLAPLQERFDVERLPYTLKILLENVLRTSTEEHVQAVAEWVAKDDPSREISFTPGRVIHQDFTGVPAIVDLAAMRHAMHDLGGDAAKTNPQLPAELVIDHSVQVDAFANRMAIRVNTDREYERNRERYAFLRWGQQAFDDLKVVPPETGIVHQVNLEYLGRVVEARNGQAFPDTLLGTDSHTTMINGLGVLGWGVGGIEAEAAMLGESVSMLVPQVVGFRLTGVHARGRDRHRPRPDGDADPPPDRRRREVRGVLRRRRLEPPARRPGDDREHVAGVRRDLRLLPRRPGHARLPAADGPPGGADRARRGLLQGESPLARPRPRADLHAGRGARSRRRRAEPRRPAATAGPCPADGREALVPGRARELRRRLRERSTTKRSPSRSPRATRPPTARRATTPSSRPEPIAVPATVVAERAKPVPVELDGAAVRARARRRRDRGDHELHEHLEPERDDRSRTRGEERRRARAPAATVGEVEPRAGLQGRHRVLRARGPHAVPRGARLPHGRLRLHDLHRELGPAARADLARRGRGRPRRLLGALRQPELRGADPSRGEGELPRLSPARRRLRAGRPDGPRPDDGAARPGKRRRGRVPLGHLAEHGGRQGDRGGGNRGRHVPAHVRRRLQGRRALELARDPRGRPLRLARGLDLRPAPAVLRRHVARARHGRGHPRRPLPGAGRRLGHDRPHLAGRGDQAGQPRREVPDRARQSSARTSTRTGRGAATTR